MVEAGDTGSVADTTRSPSDLSWSTKESTSLALLPSFMARLGPEGLTDVGRVSCNTSKGVSLGYGHFFIRGQKLLVWATDTFSFDVKSC